MSTDSIQYIEITQLQTNPFQPRGKINTEGLDELANSIKEYGILEPLVIAHTPAGYQIIAGERRWRAAKIAGLTEVPAIIKKTTPRGMLEMAIIENVQRVDLSPIERAKAFQQLMRDFGHTNAEVAKKVGKSGSYVSNSLRLLQLPDAVKDGLVSGQISEGHARALGGIEDDKEMVAVYKQVLKENASVRRTEELVRHSKARAQERDEFVFRQVVSQVDPKVVKHWQAQFGRMLKTKPKLRLSRSQTLTRITLTLKGPPEDTRQDVEKIFEIIEKNAS